MIALWHKPTYLYRLYDAIHRLLYVGVSADLARRWRDHHRDPWWRAVVRKETEQYPNLYEARHAETVAIQTERPLHNFNLRSVPLETWAIRQVQISRLQEALQTDLDMIGADDPLKGEQLRAAIAALDEKLQPVVPILREWERAELAKQEGEQE